MHHPTQLIRIRLVSMVSRDKWEIPRIWAGVFLGNFFQWLLPIAEKASQTGNWNFPPLGALLGAVAVAGIVAMVYFIWVSDQLKHTKPIHRFFFAVSMGFAIQAGQQYASVTAAAIS